MIETNVIKEIFKGHYQVILDFPSQSDLIKIIDKSYKYVWGFEHLENSVEWEKYDYFLYGRKIDSGTVFARNMDMEYLVETSCFIDLIPYVHQTIKIIQTNIIPPYYVDLKRLSGKEKYDLLKSKVDYLFELEMPGAIDYASLISPNIHFLENVIDRFNKDNLTDKT
jgi:hypothetical protein